MTSTRFPWFWRFVQAWPESDVPQDRIGDDALERIDDGEQSFPPVPVVAQDRVDVERPVGVVPERDRRRVDDVGGNGIERGVGAELPGYLPGVGVGNDDGRRIGRRVFVQSVDERIAVVARRDRHPFPGDVVSDAEPERRRQSERDTRDDGLVGFAVERDVGATLGRRRVDQDGVADVVRPELGAERGREIDTVRVAVDARIDDGVGRYVGGQDRAEPQLSPVVGEVVDVVDVEIERARDDRDGELGAELHFVDRDEPSRLRLDGRRESHQRPPFRSFGDRVFFE